MSRQIPRRTLLLGVPAACLAAGLGVSSFAKPRERVIKVVARKFVFVPETIRVKQGETVVLHLTAPEVPMGLNLPDYGKRVDIVPGKTATMKFVADKAGSFAFVCDVFCGDGHEDMQGKLVVTA